VAAVTEADIEMSRRIIDEETGQNDPSSAADAAGFVNRMAEIHKAPAIQAPRKTKGVSDVCRIAENDKASSREVLDQERLATRRKSSPGRTRT
jgi:hypothetical protein